MKRIITLTIMFVLMAAVLSGCGECEHQWLAANCETPKTCTLCGTTEGEALGHKYQAPTCETAKKCSVCGDIQGDPLGHSWKEATCTEVKTCTVCAATEGEPAGHTMKEANYQEAATCTTCGHTEGEVLAGAYDNYPMNVINAQVGVEYDYKTNCYIEGHTTVGKLHWENYRVFTSDETHEAVEGYEWHSVTVKIVFSDKDAQKYGFMVQAALDDYYWMGCEDGNGYTDQFSVNFYGQLYDQCLMANSYGSVSEWVDNTCTYTAEFAWRVPVGYTGHIILFHPTGIDLGEALENGDKTILAFRFE